MPLQIATDESPLPTNLLNHSHSTDSSQDEGNLGSHQFEHGGQQELSPCHHLNTPSPPSDSGSSALSSLSEKLNNMAYNEDSSASGHDEPWIQWSVESIPN
jgi:hypothetical protein